MKVLVFVVLCLSASAFAKECSPSDAQISENYAQYTTWKELYVGFKHYGHCDDGGPAEAWTEAVVHLLASSWPSLPSAGYFIHKDLGFHRFVLKHIDASADFGDLGKIESLSRQQCPTRLGGLCAEINTAAQKAMRESQ